MRRALWFLLLLLGCSRPLQSLQHKSELLTPIGAFAVEFSDADLEWEHRLKRAVEAAAPKLSRWGALHEPVRVQLLPTHLLLEEAVDRPGYDWLRAWARYDEVFIQSPRTWGLFGASQAEIDELVLHELTHCLMYQRSAKRSGWSRKRIPLWFREGMASVTAGQAYRWPALDQLSRYYLEHPEADPVGTPEPLYQRESEIVYSAAHHAFAFLVWRYGEEAVTGTMEKMRQGATFPEAFTEALGITPGAFTADFKRYVRWRGFRGGKRPVHPAAPVENPQKP